MKQTAVEWLASELLYLDNEYDMKLIDKNEYQAKRKEVIEQAKAKEKAAKAKEYLRGYNDAKSFDNLMEDIQNQ